VASKVASLLICSAALIGGCGSAGGQNQPVPPPSDVNAQNASAGQPAAAVSSQWLTGRWQAGSSDCRAEETQFSFGADGRYALGAEQGRWSLNGSALTLEVTRAPDGGVTAGERHTSEVAMISADEAELRTANIPPVRLHRCAGR
jgi:hypothetical protein